MNCPLVSIIVPIFNVEPYLRKCLDSLINQTYSNIQIICIDDGSTDECPEIVDEYAGKDSRIVAIHQSNQGLAAARNTGLRIAKGQWITGVDSDDWLETNAIEKAISVTDEEIDIVWFGIRVVTDDGDSDNPYYHPRQLGKHKISQDIICNTNVNFCAKLWRASLIEKSNAHFYPGLWYEDNYFYYTTAPWARFIYYCEDKLYCRFMRADSIMGTTMNQKTRKALDLLITRSLIIKNYRENGLPPIFGKKTPAPMEAFLVRGGYIFSKNHMPDDCKTELNNEAKQIICKYGLRIFMPDFDFLFHKSLFVKLFIRSKPGKIKYSFLGIPFIVKQIKNDTIVTRILGIKTTKPNRRIICKRR